MSCQPPGRLQADSLRYRRSAGRQACIQADSPCYRAGWKQWSAQADPWPKAQAGRLQSARAPAAGPVTGWQPALPV